MSLSPDKAPLWIEDDGTGRLRLALPDYPDVMWTVVVHVIDGQARITELGYAPARADVDPAIVALDHQRLSTFPLRRLAGIAARFHNLGPDGNPRDEPLDLWELLVDRPLPRRPDPRAHRFRADPNEYVREMTDWSAPIADIVRTAAAQLRPIQASLADAYGVGIRRAEQLIEIAREYHDLPKQRRNAD
ncbi:MAG: hypothetical protein WB797_13175 [Nocardioides sp.]